VAKSTEAVQPFRLPAAIEGQPAVSAELKLSHPPFGVHAQPDNVPTVEAEVVATLTLYGPPPEPLFAELKLIHPMVEDQAHPDSGVDAFAMPAKENAATMTAMTSEIFFIRWIIFY
jgi:hypothetical protein